MDSRRDRDRQILASAQIHRDAMVAHPLRDQPIPQRECGQRDLRRRKRLAVELAALQILVGREPTTAKKSRDCHPYDDPPSTRTQAIPLAIS